MGFLNPVDLLLVALVVLLVFGPRRLPELGRGIGQSLKELKQSLHGVSEPEEARLAEAVSPRAQDRKEAEHPFIPPVRNAENG
jgi:sec-independent protein translocase protein TatA